MIADARGQKRSMNDPKMYLWAGIIMLAAGALSLVSIGTVPGALLLVGGALMLVAWAREGQGRKQRGPTSG